MKKHEFHRFINQDSELVRVLKYLPSISEQGPWLAGGSIWKAIENTPIEHDIDFFFANREQYNEFIRTIKAIPYVYRIVNNKENPFNLSLGYHVHGNGYNKTIKVQLIHYKFFPTMKELLDGFDFTACQFGFDGTHLYTGNTALDDLRNREIIFNNVRSVTSSAIHLKKYLDRGFKVPTKEQEKFKKLFEAASKNTFGELESDYPQPEPIRDRFGRITYEWMPEPPEGMNAGQVLQEQVVNSVHQDDRAPISLDAIGEPAFRTVISNTPVDLSASYGSFASSDSSPTLTTSGTGLWGSPTAAQEVAPATPPGAQELSEPQLEEDSNSDLESYDSEDDDNDF
jgi:hypothetical protein